MDRGPPFGLREPPVHKGPAFDMDMWLVGAETTAAAAAVAAAVAFSGHQVGGSSASHRTASSLLGSPPQQGSPYRGFSSNHLSVDSVMLTPETVGAADEYFRGLNRSTNSACSALASPWRSSSNARSDGLGASARSSARPASALSNTSSAVLGVEGSRVPERRGAGSSVWESTETQRLGPCLQQLQRSDALEEQSSVSMSFSDRQNGAADHLGQTKVSGQDVVEQRQLLLEQSLYQLTSALQGLGKEQRIQEQRLESLETTMASTVGRCEVAGDTWLREGGDPAELERRLSALEENVAVEQRRVALSAATAAFSPLELRLNALEERSAAFAAASSSPLGPPSPMASDCALQAVQELEGLLREELKVLHQHYNNLYDVVDERVIVPLRHVEQKLIEHEQKVAQCLAAGQDCSSRVEEHEFRLGVNRTKLEVHDQKLAILDRSLRWNRRLDNDAEHPDGPTWPLPSPLGSVEVQGAQDLSRTSRDTALR